MLDHDALVRQNLPQPGGDIVFLGVDGKDLASASLGQLPFDLFHQPAFLCVETVPGNNPA
jgi:hypothetical protein